MKAHWIAVLLIVFAALFAPAVSAKIIEEKDGYTVSSVDDKIYLPGLFPMSASIIAQGQTHSYSSYVSSGKTAFMPDLNWGNPLNSLSLTIHAPDSQLGPYYDSADGRIDGRIYLRISRPTGLAPGTWWSYIYGYHVSGTQSYSYSTTVS